MIAARAAVPGLPEGSVVAAVHVMNPLTSYGEAFDEWRSNISAVGTRMVDLSGRAGLAPVVVAGDFNSTPDIRQFRDLLDHGYRDDASRIGSGWTPMYPSVGRTPPTYHH